MITAAQLSADDAAARAVTASLSDVTTVADWLEAFRLTRLAAGRGLPRH